MSTLGGDLKWLLQKRPLALVNLRMEDGACGPNTTGKQTGWITLVCRAQD